MASQQEKALKEKDFKPGDYVATRIGGDEAPALCTREGPVERIDTENPRGPKVVFYDEKHDREVAHNPTTVRKLADAEEREDAGVTVDEEGQGAEQGTRATRRGATTIPEDVKMCWNFETLFTAILTRLCEFKA